MSSERLIVVGTDGSPAGRRALAWAIAHAQATGAAVQVVTAWSWDGPAYAEGSTGGPEQAWEHAKRAQRTDVEACLAGLTDPPAVSTTVVESDPVTVLTHTARGADLLVLGSHGRGSHSVRRALLGSVSEGCIRKAETPVAVIPAHDLATGHPQDAALATSR